MRMHTIAWLARFTRLLAVAGILSSAAVHAAGEAPPVPQRLRIVGGLAGINQYTRHEAPFWTQELPKLTGGRLTAEIVPFDQAGLSGEEMLRVVQMGAVPFGTAILSRSAAAEPELAGPDLAGLNPDFASLQRSVAAYRPRLATMLRERYGLELLAIYTYPAQVIFCAKRFKTLDELSGRRIRVSSGTQADFISALGAQPVQTAFSQIVASIKAGTVDCAITGTMSGNTIGLHEVAHFIHPMAVNWGLSVFVAQRAHWAQIAPDLRAIIQREMPRLERAIWAESDRETAEGLACNTGQGSCRTGQKGNMTLVPMDPSDEQRRLDILKKSVLPSWLQRCGSACATHWQQAMDRLSAAPR